MKAISYKQITSVGQWLILCIACLCHTGCKDELIISGQTDGPEGLPATVTVSWATPDMSAKTRAALSDEEARTVNNIWIGIYDAQTGALKTKDYYDNIGTNSQEHTKYSATINTTSGRSYIVGVANVTTKYGISDNTDMMKEVLASSSNSYQGKVPLLELLQEADTWEKFKSISAALTDTANVSRFTANLVMSGIYYANDNDPDSWLQANETAVYIPAGNAQLSGSIHLRRLISYVRFNIKGGNYKMLTGTQQGQTTPVEVEPISWQVYNNPTICLLHEQNFNSADRSTCLLSEDEINADNYGTSVISYTFGTETDGVGGISSRNFDFYLYENKHEGLENVVKNYGDREKEFKDVVSESEDVTVKRNTGVYASLCETKGIPNTRTEYNVNNYATFVVIKAKVSHVVSKEMVNGVEINSQTRTSYVTYTIHLGFCEGVTEAEKALDFTNRRNTKYTYNITVNGVDDIVVEAKNESQDDDIDSEVQAGAEGDVSDTDGIYQLDAHYGVFNIQLTNNDRKALYYRIRAPFGDNVYIYDSRMDEIKGTNELSYWKNENGKYHQFYKWICFKPTESEELLAKYKTGVNDNNQWYLEDLKAVDAHPHPNSTSDNDDEPLWYTVFIDEYVYHNDENGNSMMNGNVEGGWRNYVNKDDRAVWLALKHTNVSVDEESAYSTSRYLFHQKSIQTYYNALSSTALGIEHENESYGLNMTWSNQVAEDGWNSTNGRWNQWTYLRDKDWSVIADFSGTDNKYLQRAVSPAITRQKETKAETYPTIFQQHPQTTSGTLSEYTPNNSSRYYEYMVACMTRNRDENGDGKISAAEVKWYLPTSGKYLRMILGQYSMADPLMNFEATPELPYGAGSAYNNRYHYATSDRYIIWAEEGVSSSELNRGYIGNTPWQIRCVRNLGVDQTEIPGEDPVETAYQLDEDNNHVVRLIYYDASSIRSAIGTYLPVHTINSDRNMCAAAFEYAKEDKSGEWNDGSGLNSSGTAWATLCSSNEICGAYTQETDGKDLGTWRVPNQRELTILRRLGVFTESGVKWLSCSQEYYGNKRFLGVTTKITTAGHGGALHTRVRCVRDYRGN